MHTDNDGGLMFLTDSTYCYEESATVAAARDTAVRPYPSICAQPLSLRTVRNWYKVYTSYSCMAISQNFSVTHFTPSPT